MSYNLYSQTKTSRGPQFENHKSVDLGAFQTEAEEVTLIEYCIIRICRTEHIRAYYNINDRYTKYR